MGETQASHNWRGNEAFSKPRPFRDEVIDELTDELIPVAYAYCEKNGIEIQRN